MTLLFSFCLFSVKFLFSFLVPHSQKYNVASSCFQVSLSSYLELEDRLYSVLSPSLFYFNCYAPFQRVFTSDSTWKTFSRYTTQLSSQDFHFSLLVFALFHSSTHLIFISLGHVIKFLRKVVCKKKLEILMTNYSNFACVPAW